VNCIWRSLRQDWRLAADIFHAFFFKVGQTQKAFEHLGNALTYDPTFAKVREQP
jgi:hypothetical protein